MKVQMEHLYHLPLQYHICLEHHIVEFHKILVNTFYYYSPYIREMLQIGHSGYQTVHQEQMVLQINLFSKILLLL